MYGVVMLKVLVLENLWVMTYQQVEKEKYLLQKPTNESIQMADGEVQQSFRIQSDKEKF
ncbi:hypothetical protein D3C86_588650 [compost metagenome]